MLCMIILKLARAFHKLSTVSYIRSFHGTNALNLPSIAREGFQPQRPGGANSD